MTDDVFKSPFGGDDDDAGSRDRGGLPEHEIDDDDTVGGGVMASGATAVDRGTGELDGTAQSRGDDEGGDSVDDMDGVNNVVIGGAPAGGAQPYVPAFVQDDDDEGGSLPDA